MTEQPRICGVVAILIDDDGDVAASVSDFETAHPGGYRLKDAQEARCKNAIAWKLVQTFCSARVVEGFEMYDAQRLLERLLHRKKWKLKFEYVGHEADER